jgi:hypothetical protein
MTGSRLKNAQSSSCGSLPRLPKSVIARSILFAHS